MEPLNGHPDPCKWQPGSINWQSGRPCRHVQLQPEAVQPEIQGIYNHAVQRVIAIVWYAEQNAHTLRQQVSVNTIVLPLAAAQCTMWCGDRIMLL